MWTRRIAGLLVCLAAVVTVTHPASSQQPAPSRDPLYVGVPNRVEVKGFTWKDKARIPHGVPSHGVAMSPDEKEIWVADGVDGTDALDRRVSTGGSSAPVALHVAAIRTAPWHN